MNHAEEEEELVFPLRQTSLPPLFLQSNFLQALQISRKFSSFSSVNFFCSANYAKQLLNDGISPRVLLTPLKVPELSILKEDFPTTQTQNKSNRQVEGEKRLNINFENFGELGRFPQYFGRKKCTYIPNGLKGTHMMYDEPWKFEVIVSENDLFIQNGLKCICIVWKISNLSLTSAINLEVKESRDEAVVRMATGKTICSKVFKLAIDERARELEEYLKNENNEERDGVKRIKIVNISNIQAKISSLRPNKFCEGSLAFGLQHSIVQEMSRKDKIL